MENGGQNLKIISYYYYHACIVICEYGSIYYDIIMSMM